MSSEETVSLGFFLYFAFKKLKTSNQPPTLFFKENYLTSSDPVSDGLAFLGAITGESDPSKSSCKK